MRGRDLAWPAVFPDPFTRLSRPVSDVIGPTRVILENDDVPVPGCGLDRVAHAVLPCLRETILSHRVLREIVLAQAMAECMTSEGEYDHVVRNAKSAWLQQSSVTI